MRTRTYSTQIHNVVNLNPSETSQDRIIPIDA